VQTVYVRTIDQAKATHFDEQPEINTANPSSVPRSTTVAARRDSNPRSLGTPAHSEVCE
jgi:hypothetical protein